MRARQKVSRAGVELIKSFEGLRQTAARLPDGRWTLGYGHTFSAREGAKVTSEDADALLRFDLLPIVDAVNNLVLIPLNQNQFDALVSFCFNIGVDNFGASTVLKRINEGRMTEAALAMDSWRSAEFNGQTYVLAPLIRRRAAEKNLFLTPDETTGMAPSLLVRPMPDTLADQGAPAAPAELAAPVTGGILSATPLSSAPASAVPYPSVAQVELPANAGMPPVMPTTIVPVPEPVAPPQRQVIDLAQFTPRVPSTPFEDVPPPVQPVSVPPATPAYLAPAYAAPVETAVESLPGGMPSGVIREMPVAAPTAPVAAPFYLSAHDDGAPMMSADTQAALQRAQEEQRQQDLLREEAQRQAQVMAAARAAEEMRLAEQQRQEAVRQEQLRLEMARQEQARLEQERAEQARLEQARLEQERAEQARLEAARAEAARLEAERAERERQEQMRLEQARLEQERVLEQQRLEQARLEQERLERERAEEQRRIQEKLEQEKLEQQRTETARVGVAPAAVADADEAEKARKAEAAAALMRLYSPYGSGLGLGLGRPIGNLLPTNPAPLAVKGTPVSQPLYAEPPVTPVVPESVPVAEVAPEIKPVPEIQIPEPVQTFGVSPSTLPPPVVTALNPYARPTPQVFEVPRPAAVDLSQSEPLAPSTTAAATPATPSWREQLQRPLPEGYQAPQAAAAQRAPQPTLVPTGQASRFDQPYEVEDDDWALDGDRVALSSEEMEENTVSWWKMITSTFWWLVISVCGIVFLGMAAGSYWRSTQDLTVIRNGAAQFYTFMSVSAAAVGILLVSISVWLIMKRLGGLKD